VADVPEIAVAAVDFGPASLNRDPVLFSVVKAVFARLQRPLTPRRNHLQFRSQGLVSQFETNLIIAFARTTVSNGSGTDAKSNFDLVFCDYRARERCAQ